MHIFCTTMSFKNLMYDFLLMTYPVSSLVNMDFVLFSGIYEVFSKKKCQVGLQSERYPGANSVMILKTSYL